METTAYRCPHCGADLNIQAGAMYYTCPACNGDLAEKDVSMNTVSRIRYDVGGKPTYFDIPETTVTLNDQQKQHR